jgi:hypothetical protein
VKKLTKAGRGKDLQLNKYFYSLNEISQAIESIATDPSCRFSMN